MAPLSGITDLPFRTIMREHGLSFAFTEMLAIKPLLTRMAKSWSYLRTTPADQPLGTQIVGSDPAMMAEAAAILEATGIFSLIDINFGCPARKVVSKGEGSALLKEPRRIEKIVSSVVKKTSLPVSAKMRIGWSVNTLNAVDVARRIEGAGACAVTVHGRTKDRGYGGPVNYDAIRAVKEALHIPVIGNGNIFSAGDAQQMFAQTGCDMVMIARGALGNPWIFKEIQEGRPQSDAADMTTVKRTLLRHAEYMFDFYGEKKAITLLRKIGCWYFKGFGNKSHYKDRMSRIKTRDEFYTVVEEYAAGASAKK